MVSVSRLGKELALLLLETRKVHQGIALMFKIMHGKMGITRGMLGLEDADPRTRGNHRFKFKLKTWRTDGL